MRTRLMATAVVACMLLVSLPIGPEKQLDDVNDASFAGSTGETTAWGVSYDWSDLPADIRDTTGIDIDNMLEEIERAAADGGIALDLTYGIQGFTHYYVSQGPGASTEIRLDGGERVDVNSVVTSITLRTGISGHTGVDASWSDGSDVGFSLDYDDSSELGAIFDIETTEYYTQTGGFAGMDMTATGSLSYQATMRMDGSIVGGRDTVAFDGTKLTIDMEWELNELSAEWRMGEISSIYQDLTSGDYDYIQWECGDISHYEEWDMETRREWTQSDNYDTKSTGRYADGGDYVETDHDYPNNDYDEWTISDPGAQAMRLHFDRFETEGYYDQIEVYDARTDDLIDVLDGNQGYNYVTGWYQTDSIRLEWDADGSYTDWGFELDQWESGESADGVDYLWMIDDCGDVEVTWDSTFKYDFKLTDFPAEDLGFTSDEASFQVSDILTSHGSENDDFRAYSDFEIVDHDYSIQNPDGTTQDVVRITSNGPMSVNLDEVLDVSIGQALDFDNGDFNEDIEDIAEDWEDNYDERDNALLDMENNYEDSDFVDDFEEFAEEYDENMEDIEDGADSIYTDVDIYWLIDKDSYQYVSPQMIVADEDGDEIQMIGPAGTGYAAPQPGLDLEIEFKQDQAAVDKQNEVDDISTMDELISGRTASDALPLMLYLLIAGGVIVLIGAGVISVIFVLRRKQKDDPYLRQNEAFENEVYDNFASNVGHSEQGPPMIHGRGHSPQGGHAGGVAQPAAAVATTAPVAPPVAPPTQPMRICTNCGSPGTWHKQQQWHWCELCAQWLP